MVRQGLVLGIAVLVGAGLLGAAQARAGGDVTVQERYPGSRLRPGSPGNPYELHERGQRPRELEETYPPTASMPAGSEANPYRLRPQQDLERWNGHEMLSLPDDDDEDDEGGD